MNPIWTKDKIRLLLQSDNRAVERAIVAIYHRQTFDEQATKETKHHNNMGFSSAHSRLGTYYAEWVLKGNHLTGNHLEKARKIALRYTDQLLKVAKEKTK